MFESWEPCFILCNTLKKVMVSITLFQKCSFVKNVVGLLENRRGEGVKKAGLQTKPAYTHHDEPRHEVNGKV